MTKVKSEHLVCQDTKDAEALMEVFGNFLNSHDHPRFPELWKRAHAWLRAMYQIKGLPKSGSATIDHDREVDAANIGWHLLDDFVAAMQELADEDLHFGDRTKKGTYGYWYNEFPVKSAMGPEWE